MTRRPKTWTVGLQVQIPLEAWIYVRTSTAFKSSCVGNGFAIHRSLVPGNRRLSDTLACSPDGSNKLIKPTPPQKRVKYEIRAVNEEVQAIFWPLSEKRCTKRHDNKPCCGRTNYKSGFQPGGDFSSPWYEMMVTEVPLQYRKFDLSFGTQAWSINCIISVQHAMLCAPVYFNLLTSHFRLLATADGIQNKKTLLSKSLQFNTHTHRERERERETDSNK